MKKLDSTISNMVLVLVGVALITGAILAYVNHITTEPIRQQSEKTLTEGIKKVMGGGDLKVTSNDTVSQNLDGKPVTFVVHVTESVKGEKLGVAVESTTSGFGGDLKVLVGFSPAGEILGYTILQTSETPGLGAKAETWFQKDGKGNIIGKNPSEGPLAVSKDGGQVNAITASTITSRAFLKAVNNAYNAYKAGKTDATSGATKLSANK